MTKHASSHPFYGVKDIPNVFYFLSTHPQRYDPRHYFMTFPDLSSSDKEEYCKYWEKCLKILRASDIDTYKKVGDHLYTTWKDQRLDAFWEERKQEETKNELDGDLASTLVWTRKRTLQSVRHQFGSALDALDALDASVPHSSYKRSRCSRSDNKAENQSDVASENSDVSRIVLEADPPTLSTTSTYYLTGDGSTRCSMKLWQPWVVQGKDISSNLWRFRQDVCSKARALQPLVGSVEKLAVNHVYLFEPSDSSSQLFNSLGAEVWSHITKPTLEKKVPKKALAELTEFAFDVCGMSHTEAQNRVMKWKGDETTQKFLSSLLADKFLWDASDFNELEMIQHLYNPFLTAFVSEIGHGRWDKMFLPSQQRKDEAMAEGRGRRPDYYMYCKAAAKDCHVFMMEAKKSEQGNVLQNDLEKVALLMKDAIDDMGKCRIDISKVKLFGMVIVGAEGAVYSMELPSRGLYIMRRYATVYAPRSQHDLHVLAGTINVFMSLEEELAKTIRVCRGPLLGSPAGLTRPSFGTPIKVTLTGIKSGFDPSPSLRPRANPGKSKKRA